MMPLAAVPDVPGFRQRLGRRLAAIDWSRIWMGAIGIVTLVVLWWIAALVIGDDVILPSPLRTMDVMIRYLSKPYPSQGETLVGNTLISLARILVGFTWGALAGIFLGALMASVRPVRLIVDPLIELGRPLPPLAFIPLLIVWFGIGELPKIILIGVGVIPVMVVSVVAALDAVPEEYVEAALSLGATRSYALLHVRIRAALPAVITGLRLSMGLSWTSIVAVEMIAATGGLGYVILEASNYLITPLIFSGILLIAVVALFLDGLLRLLRRLVAPMG
ncbi:MAG: ABC transporter permease [Rhodospirillales bacterium]|nr:ABC transporter permease [Rhodospirillales bacterium]